MHSQETIRLKLRMHQKMLAAGDCLPSLSELARRAGIHRDTIYALIDGDRVCQRTQYALSRVLQEVEQETRLTPKTKLMSLFINQGCVSLQIGLGNRTLLRKR
jgi:hypothetical protein